MSTLSKKIDFVLFFSVKDANPNGDPLLENMPRTDYEGHGEVSDVCLKRKIRNRLQDAGYEIFVQANDRIEDGMKSLEERFGKEFTSKQDDSEVREKACEKWMDVRSFGQVITFQKRSIGIRGPVSISLAKSLDPVSTISMQITRSTNGMKAAKEGGRSSDTMGTKNFVEFGIYKACGSINCYFAEKTGFSDEDAEAIKKALLTLFENDMSSARPEGSMAVERLYWFTHPNKLGIASSAKIHRLVTAEKKCEGEPKSFADYEVSVDEERLASYQNQGLQMEVLDGE
ncbi:MAG: type I-C CRISPR-associated protein Cas7/Csd2 [Acidaminococcus sp.]|jgi:CRISPR-associated protein Csd2|nr:type I-C CRISPR-associated protein Cas7/Csd2 [Acidaminococcus sp.]MCI2100916.1 type I-C CRISPR-associated protein Cas7/Csd2 [Acidaminococcus sp.]MCI2115250.1 type I-C CRISPR-associated protein Cas7/Csd2 [Acidaminococcus sp.]